MDRKSDLTNSLLKLQALRDKVRLTEEAQIRQQNLRKEYEDKTEKLIAENDKISAKLLEKQKTTKQYKDISEKLYRQKAELEKKLRILQGRLQENPDEIQCEKNLVEKPVVMVKHKATSAESETTSKHDEIQCEKNLVEKPMVMVKHKATSAESETTSKHDEIQCEKNLAVKPVVMVRHKVTSAESETTSKHDEVEYNTSEEIWELKKSIEEIEAQLNALEKKKD